MSVGSRKKTEKNGKEDTWQHSGFPLSLREILKSSSYQLVHFHNCPTEGLGWVDARVLELTPGLPSGFQDPNEMTHHHRLPACVLAGRWNQVMEPRPDE